MKGIDKSNIVLCIFILLPFVVFCDNNIQTIINESLETHLILTNNNPTIGEEFEIIYTIKLKENCDSSILNVFLKNLSVTVNCFPQGSLKFLGKDSLSSLNITPVKYQQLKVKCKIVEWVKKIYIDANTIYSPDKGEQNFSCGAEEIILYLKNRSTGQYSIDSKEKNLETKISKRESKKDLPNKYILILAGTAIFMISLLFAFKR
ncbi:hypothetical protein DRP43_02030 [candidate division TA06 bacterium]|uniref:Uncharacterized protein n=1 Tax=candidate division TA06 bacterium TaxID=2250710 RepID=A0A660SP68_UNCT6|nr:MAG: hypothetical protein DRP43_02030 [candidate division TA06 bacterium]